jgi:hypothetical protein
MLQVVGDASADKLSLELHIFPSLYKCGKVFSVKNQLQVRYGPFVHQWHLNISCNYSLKSSLCKVYTCKLMTVLFSYC